MKLIFILISILIIPGAFHGLVDSFTVFIQSSSVFYPVMAGFVAATILYYAVLRNFYAIQNFEHELTHAIVALAFFRRINRFVSTGRGGYVSHSGGIGGPVGDVLITLGPYYLPTFTVIFAFIRPFPPTSWFPWYDIIIGFTLGYHTVSTIDEIIRNYSKRTFYYVGTNKITHTDIGRIGLITSGFIIAALTLLLHGIAFNLIVGGYSAVDDYSYLVFEEGRNLCLWFYEVVVVPIIKSLNFLD